MTMRRRALGVRLVAIVAIAIGLAGGLIRAAQNQKFAERQEALRQQWQADRQQQGLEDSGQRQALYAKYPTPEITMCETKVVAPGTSASVSLGGAFPDGTTFLVEHDGVEASGGMGNAKSYTTTLIVPGGLLPSYVRLNTYAPVSGAFNRCAPAFIGPASTYTMKAGNGWTIKATPAAAAFTLEDASASLAYRVDFFKPGGSQPFETMSSVLRIQETDTPGGSLQFALQEGADSGSAQAELEQLTRRMGDLEAMMKMSPEEQDALMAKMEQLTERMMSEQMAAIQDPAAMQKKQDDFGCGHMTISSGEGGALTGSVSCGRNVGSLELTGSATAG